MWFRRRSPARFAAAIATGVLVVLIGAKTVSSHETLTTTVLFDREIVRVLNAHCVMCHADGGPSFPLETYEQTWLTGRKMRSDVIARHMPPWAAVQGYGHFANDNSLTLRETQFVISWVEGLGPRNAGFVFTNVVDPNAKRREAVKAHPKFGQWDLGEPDLTRPLPANTVEPGRGPTVVRTVVDLGLTSPRRVRAVQFMPGDRRVVRAAFFTIQETGQWIGSWTPWYGFVELPTGATVRLEPSSHVVAEIHYQPAKERVIDRGTLGLSFATAATSTVVGDLVLDATGEVPAGAHAQRFHADTTLTADTTAIALWPEVQQGITSIEVSAKKPNGTTEVLLFAKDIPVDWPTPYVFKEPITEQRGTTISAVAYYDNASAASQRGGLRLHVSAFKQPTPTTRSTTRRTPEPGSARGVKAAAPRYPLTGKVVSIDKSAHKVTVDHQAIPGLMPAMTMAYTVNDSRALDSLSPGDAITATVVRANGDYSLENVVSAPKKR